MPTRAARLLQHFFELLADYGAVEAVNRDMQPVAFFAFHDELRETRCPRRVMPGLRDEIH